MLNTHIFIYLINIQLIKLICLIGASMNKSKPRRVNYRINYCSSEDPEYPVSELVLQSTDSKGWQTKRFA